MFARVFLLLLVLNPASASETSRSKQVEDAVLELQRSPVEALWRTPPKWDERGDSIDPSESLFAPEDILSGEFVVHKTRPRVSRERARFHAMARLDSARELTLVGEARYKALDLIEEAGLAQGTAETSPWSGDYWPLYAGSLARRYDDPSFPDSRNWKLNADYVLSDRNSSSIDSLSPAEKYDLLVGDSDRTLTRTMLAEGEEFYEAEGEVESWMGICHGWAPASYRESRPSSTLELLAADGRTKIRFRPSDIKGLISLLWAKLDVPTRYSGQRCDDKKPKIDANGRLVSPGCFDTNPAAWHLTVVNVLGGEKKSFVIDATFDHQVWNQPVYSYRYTYFNPVSGKSASTWREARVSPAEHMGDRFKAYRAPAARYLVGVAMDLTYVAEESASPAEQDHEDLDRRITVRYLYDLETDSDGTILGGEWYTNLHPDFMWTPVEGIEPEGPGDEAIDRQTPGSSWDGKRPVPAAWRKVAARSSRLGVPLAKIVRAMAAFSSLGI